MMRKTIRDKSPTKRRVDSKAIVKAVGAEETKVDITTGRGPISLFALRLASASIHAEVSTIDTSKMKEKHAWHPSS